MKDWLGKNNKYVEKNKDGIIMMKFNEDDWPLMLWLIPVAWKKCDIMKQIS